MMHIEGGGKQHFVIRERSLRVRGYQNGNGSWGVMAYVVESPILCDITADRRSAFTTGIAWLRAARDGRDRRRNKSSAKSF